MATAVLVDKDLDIGRKVLAALTRAHIPVSMAFWAYVPQISEWQLFIATPLVDSKSHKSAYEQVLRTLQHEGINGDLPWRRIFLRSPRDSALKSLEKKSKGTPREIYRLVNEEISGSFIEDAYIYNGFIDIQESESIPRGSPSVYYVTYAPYSGPGDAFCRVTGLDDLRELLSMLHLSQDVVESALSELSAKKTALIPNVKLRAQDVKRLRPD
jgi:hypothetical protein